MADTSKSARPRLGRGLSSLISSSTSTPTQEGQYQADEPQAPPAPTDVQRTAAAAVTEDWATAAKRGVADAAGWEAACQVMRQLNREFRSTDRVTDVLSFPGDGERDPDGSVYLGDVVISAPTAEREAGRCGHSLGHELQTLALHGYLHLLGYDHETDDGRMLRFQRRLQSELIDSGAKG